MEALGIDIGGSGVKGAIVNTHTGELTTDRIRIPTPQPATPKSVIKTVGQIVKELDYRGPIGVGFPGVVIDGVTQTAANLDDGWVGLDVADAIAHKTGCSTVVRNDADVAGIAEMDFGAGKGEQGVVMIFTLGTGIGSVMFVNGQIVPNLELGHLYLPGMKKDAESYTAERIRDEENLSWKKWGKRLNEYFHHIEFLFSPQVLIIGGGVSKKHAKYFDYIKTQADLRPAALRNEAGIVGAAMAGLSHSLATPTP